MRSEVARHAVPRPRTWITRDSPRLPPIAPGLLKLVQFLAKLSDFLRRWFAQRQRLLDELFRRAAEDPIKQVPNHIAARVLFGQGSVVHLRAFGHAAAADIPLGRHDLHELQNTAVAAAPGLA